MAEEGMGHSDRRGQDIPLHLQNPPLFANSKATFYKSARVFGSSHSMPCIMETNSVDDEQSLRPHQNSRTIPSSGSEDIGSMLSNRPPNEALVDSRDGTPEPQLGQEERLRHRHKARGRIARFFRRHKHPDEFNYNKDSPWQSDGEQEAQEYPHHNVGSGECQTTQFDDVALLLGCIVSAYNSHQWPIVKKDTGCCRRVAHPDRYYHVQVRSK